MNTESEKPIALEVFRGETDENGKVRPMRRIGKCLFYQKTGAHVVHVDLFHGPEKTFFLRPFEGPSKDAFKITMKEQLARSPDRYVHRQVGVAQYCASPNEDLLYLEWDFVGPVGIYLRLLTSEPQAEKVSA